MISFINIIKNGERQVLQRSAGSSPQISPGLIRPINTNQQNSSQMFRRSPLKVPLIPSRNKQAFEYLNDNEKRMSEVDLRLTKL